VPHHPAGTFFGPRGLHAIILINAFHPITIVDVLTAKIGGGRQSLLGYVQYAFFIRTATGLFN